MASDLGSGHSFSFINDSGRMTTSPITRPWRSARSGERPEGAKPSARETDGRAPSGFRRPPVRRGWGGVRLRCGCSAVAGIRVRSSLVAPPNSPDEVAIYKQPRGLSTARIKVTSAQPRSSHASANDRSAPPSRPKSLITTESTVPALPSGLLADDPRLAVLDDDVQPVVVDELGEVFRDDPLGGEPRAQRGNDVEQVRARFEGGL